MHEAESNTEIGRHPVRRITFLARGPADTSESSCFAFTCPREDSEETAVFQCHLFRCEIAEVLPEVMRSLIRVCYNEGEIEQPVESQVSKLLNSVYKNQWMRISLLIIMNDSLPNQVRISFFFKYLAVLFYIYFFQMGCQMMRNMSAVFCQKTRQ